MKLRSLSLVLFLSGAVQSAAAQTTAPSLPDRIAQARSALAHDDAKLAAASSAGARAKSHYDFLVAEIFEPIKQDLATYTSDALIYDGENSAVESAINQHDANLCTAAECEASYNAERDRLNAEATQMQSRKAALDQRRDALNARYGILNSDGRATAQTAKQALADYAQALSDHTTMSAQLEALKSQSEDCKATLRSQGQSLSDVLIAQCGDDQYNVADKTLPPPPACSGG
jgi:chromosome segregation ATPase